MLDKAIKSGKEHRQEYRKPKSIDPSCRNHGDCERCQGNRHYQINREKERMEDAYLEYEEERR